MRVFETNLPIYLMWLGISALVIVAVWGEVWRWNNPLKRDDTPWDK